MPFFSLTCIPKLYPPEFEEAFEQIKFSFEKSFPNPMPSPVTLDLRFGDGIEFWKGFYQTLTSCIPKLYPPYFEEPFEQTKFSFEKCFPNSMPSPVTLDLRFGDGIEFWKGFYQTLTSLGSLRSVETLDIFCLAKFGKY